MSDPGAACRTVARYVLVGLGLVAASFALTATSAHADLRDTLDQATTTTVKVVKESSKAVAKPAAKAPKAVRHVTQRVERSTAVVHKPARRVAAPVQRTVTKAQPVTPKMVKPVLKKTRVLTHRAERPIKVVRDTSTKLDRAEAVRTVKKTVRAVIQKATSTTKATVAKIVDVTDELTTLTTPVLDLVDSVGGVVDVPDVALPEIAPIILPEIPTLDPILAPVPGTALSPAQLSTSSRTEHATHPASSGRPTFDSPEAHRFFRQAAAVTGMGDATFVVDRGTAPDRSAAPSATVSAFGLLDVVPTLPTTDTVVGASGTLTAGSSSGSSAATLASRLTAAATTTATTTGQTGTGSWFLTRDPGFSPD